MSYPQSSTQQGSILIVDDNPANLNLLREILSGAGYRARAAINSQLALKSIESSQPDLILLDILMPDMDGYQMCETLKASPETQNIPVIFISALNDVADKIKAFAMGGVDYITKPFQAEEILARIENQLRLRHLSKQLLEQNIKLEQELQERLQAEQALQASQSLLTGIIEGTTDQIAALDLDLRYIAFNRAYKAEFLKLFGRDIAIGTSLIEALNDLPEQQAQWVEMWRRAVAGEQFTLIQEFGKAEGDRNYYEITYSSIKDKNGQLLGASHIIKNVSDRIRSEQALRDSERRLTLALSGANAGTWELNSTTNQWVWSKENFKLLGYEPEHCQADYENWLKVVYPDDRERADGYVRQVIADNSELALEYRVLLPDNTIRWLRAIGQFIPNQEGNLTSMAGIQIDITERKQLEDELAHQKELLDAFFNSAHVGMCALDNQMRFFMVNEALADINGVSVEGHIGKTPWDIVPDLAPKQEAIFRQILTTGQPVPLFEISGETQKSPGTARTWLASYFPIRGQNHQPIGIGIVVVEITERKAAEAALQESESKLQAILDNAPAVIYVKNIEGQHILVNRHFLDVFHLAPDQCIGKSNGELFPSDMAESIQANDKIVLESKAPYQFEEQILLDDGIHTYYSVKFPLWDASGNPYAICGISTDVSDRIQAEALIKASLREKEVLLQEIHHRVKNNLQIVSSLLQMQLRRTKDQEAALVLQDSKNRIASIALVHEKLYRSDDLANIDFAQYIPDLTIHLFDSYKVSSELVTLKTQIDQIFLEVETAIPCGLIINELVSNSLKYAFPGNRQGEIKVEFKANNNDTLMLIVRDNGIGIPQEFDIETTTSLGLTLVQGLVEQLDGTLSVDCSQGTEFKIIFPKKL
ncbi:MAG TPA: PAS domain-containing protein [Cyanophyceae cyanobacterium]